MNSTKVIVPFALAVGVLLYGPVWTMTMYPEMFGASYAFGVIDALSVVCAILWWRIGYGNISRSQD